MQHDAKRIIFQQLFEANCSGYTYIIADPDTLDGVIIDPVLETVHRDILLLSELGITLRYILETHVHADHITGAGIIAKKTGALIAMSAASGARFDIALEKNSTLYCGSIPIHAIPTPGHTKGCISYRIENAVFTGDTLLIRGNGRTDFQNGSPEILYESIMNALYTLPDDTLVYPAHDYSGFTCSTIGMEKRFNKRIRAETSKKEFIETMNNVQLPLPKKIDIAVPANMDCARDVVL